MWNTDSWPAQCLLATRPTSDQSRASDYVQKQTVHLWVYVKTEMHPYIEIRLLKNHYFVGFRFILAFKQTTS